MRIGVALLGLAAACKALPPPPMVPLHGDTAPAPDGTTTAMLVVGVAGEILGGGGLGAAVRVEHHVTSRNALGLELGAGRGTDDYKFWLYSGRVYGRSTPGASDHVAVVYGAGLSYLDVGLVTLTLHAGGATSGGNRYVAGYGGAGAAAVIPLRRGKPWGMGKPRVCLGCFEPRSPDEPRADPPDPVRADLLLYVDLGFVGILGDSGNRLSLDLALAFPLRVDEMIVSASVADAQRWTPD